MDQDQNQVPFNSGSHWHRWEPHIHAPGTLLNDQFGDNAWDAYLTQLESLAPVIRALGVTDYYDLATYERVLEAKQKGRLPQCDLIFPNVEMRFDIGTQRGRHVNVHLLVSPEDPQHLTELRRFLSKVAFTAFDDSFSCTREDLIRLGNRTDSKLAGLAALQKGAEQFKVSLASLRAAYAAIKWAEDNILLAVAGSERDGTSGVRDGADVTLRQEIEKFAHVIFASSVAQREFWIGRKSATREMLEQRYDGLKPCLHGSDAHELAKVGKPDDNRYCWIKGKPAFDTLRQACIDPAGRAFIGEHPPQAALPSQTIKSIHVKGASWANTPQIELNPGLVAIIGARGSGKTALAEMIAAGCDAVPEHASAAAFLARARDHLNGASVSMKWQSDESYERPLVIKSNDDGGAYPRARYLSQQFVEELCSADGMTDVLLQEIERVIFEAHSPGDLDGTTSFDELLDLRASRFRQARQREEAALTSISERIGIEREKTTQIAALKTQIEEKTKQIARHVEDRSKLVSKGSEDRVKRLSELNIAAEKIRGHVRAWVAAEQSLLLLKDEVETLRNTQAPEMLRRSKEKHKGSGIKDEDWKAFLLGFTGDVDGVLTTGLKQAESEAKAWKGIAPPPVVDPTKPLIADDADLSNSTLAELDAEIARMQLLVSVDKDTALKFAAISKRVTDETQALERLKEKLTDCEGAASRIQELQKERDASYMRIFEAIKAEQEVLVTLYAPLRKRLDESGGTLQKLSFSVRREVDVGRWAAQGEGLLDLRIQGAFKGKGALRQLAEGALRPAWETGDPTAICQAMGKFIEEHRKSLLEQAAVPKSDLANYRDWLARFAKWLFSTDHIHLHYSIDYDSIDIRKLSPGTRGIVLLLLYLALDSADDRPLIIDQPEENLDPKSIYSELVGLFLKAKSSRQVILVTHNANLVINADADQVIVASAGPHPPGQLPPITYVSGGLESESIRQLACDILEGGVQAFQDRARRLRVKLQR